MGAFRVPISRVLLSTDVMAEYLGQTARSRGIFVLEPLSVVSPPESQCFVVLSRYSCHSSGRTKPEDALPYLVLTLNPDELGDLLSLSPDLLWLSHETFFPCISTKVYNGRCHLVSTETLFCIIITLFNP